MKYYFKPSFVLIIIALIVGGALIREFDFKQLSFDNTALGLIYLATFVACIFMMIKKKSE